MSEPGCLTPFGSKNSEICSDEESKNFAMEIFGNLTWVESEQKKRCPLSCTKIVTIIGDFYETEKREDFLRRLVMRFHTSIKVTRSRNAYGSLELMAEVGGYVGLFLGISVNQISWIIRKCFGSLVKLAKTK